jgi:TatD DNase family protein
MVFIDIHCHLEYNSTIDEAGKKVKNAALAGVGVIVSNSVDFDSMKKTLELASLHSEVKAACGIYPIDALKLSESELDNVIEFIRQNKDKIKAVGEVGIDLKWSGDFEAQKRIFEKFIDLAIKIDKPLIVHSRKAEKQVIEILEAKGVGKDKVIMHCFFGGEELAKRIIDNGWMLSIPTNVVYSKEMQKLAEIVPAQNMFCETDSPYLHPFKEKNNEPALVVEAYKKIAEIKGISLGDVEKQVEDNFKRVFG